MALTVIPYNPASDPWQYAAQGMQNMLGGMNTSADMQLLGQALQGGGMQGLQSILPQLRDPQLRNAVLGMVMQGMQPLNPLEEAQRQNYLASAKESNAKAKALGMPSTNTFTKTIWDSENKKGYEVLFLTDEKTGQTTPVEILGEAVPSATMGNVDPNMLTTTTTTKVQGDIQASQDMLDNLQMIRSLYDPRFLEYKGKAAAWITSSKEKLGFKSDEEATAFLSNRQAFDALAQEVFLQKRKEITGVASNPAEQVDIARAVIDPTRDSPTQFESKLNLLETIQKRHMARLQQWLNFGVPNPTKKQLSEYPLFSQTESKALKEGRNPLSEKPPEWVGSGQDSGQSQTPQVNTRLVRQVQSAAKALFKQGRLDQTEYDSIMSGMENHPEMAQQVSEDFLKEFNLRLGQ